MDFLRRTCIIRVFLVIISDVFYSVKLTENEETFILFSPHNLLFN